MSVGNSAKLQSRVLINHRLARTMPVKLSIAVELILCEAPDTENLVSGGNGMVSFFLFFFSNSLKFEYLKSSC